MHYQRSLDSSHPLHAERLRTASKHQQLRLHARTYCIYRFARVCAVRSSAGVSLHVLNTPFFPDPTCLQPPQLQSPRQYATYWCPIYQKLPISVRQESAAPCLSSFAVSFNQPIRFPPCKAFTPQLSLIPYPPLRIVKGSSLIPVFPSQAYAVLRRFLAYLPVYLALRHWDVSLIKLSPRTPTSSRISRSTLHV